MPELPEVETTRGGIEPHLLRKRVRVVRIRQPSLRWPVPLALSRQLPGQEFTRVTRRAKYLLLETARGTLLIHLGMSGSLRVIAQDLSPGKHDHVDIVLDDGKCLRFNDPRRFGCMLWLEPGSSHPLLDNLGPEPLAAEFDGDYLYSRSRKRSAAVKAFIMDGRIVVGVGNIYASEALFMAGIDPRKAAGKISRERYRKLAGCIRKVLLRAIRAGGTTLRDFSDSDGNPGYFRQSLKVYGRGGLPCKNCDAELKEIRIGQRSSVYCRVCQK